MQMAALRSNEVLPLDHVTSTAEYKRSIYHITVPRRFTWENVLVPEWFRNVTMLKTHDLLELEAEDGSFDALARVTSCDKGFAVLRVLRLWKAPVEEIQGEAGSIGFIVGRGWTMFDFDGNPIATFVSEEQAQEALKEYREHDKLDEPKEQS
jgi:hypothetical protein